MGDHYVSKSMKIVDALKCIGESDFTEQLGIEIQDHPTRIGLDEYCNQGGSIGDVCVEEIEWLGVVQDSGLLLGKFHIGFEESYHGGCRDIEWSDSFYGWMEFSINLYSGELNILNEEINKSLDESEEEPEGVDNTLSEQIVEGKVQ